MDEGARARLTEILAEVGSPEPAGRDPVRTWVLRDDALYQEMRRIQDRLRDDFARSHGWVVAQTRFVFEELVTGTPQVASTSLVELIDHADAFREQRKPYRPTALLAHSYTLERAPFDALARETGLPVEFLDWSWHDPENCTAALFRRI